MAVSQRFIDLLNLPMSALLKLATDLQVELPTGARQWDIAKLVARASRDELEDNDQGFLYAGRTSLSFFRLVANDGNISEDDVEIFRPIPGDALDHDAVVAALQECADCDPFDENDLPADITKEPILVLARDWQGGIILTFAAAKRVDEQRSVLRQAGKRRVAAFGRPRRGPAIRRCRDLRPVPGAVPRWAPARR